MVVHRGLDNTLRGLHSWRLRRMAHLGEGAWSMTIEFWLRLRLFFGIVWRRVDTRCPDRLEWCTAWEVACIIYPWHEVKP